MPRISQLPALTVPEANDEIAIVDASAATTKKITRADFLKGAALPADTVDTQAIADGSVTAPKTAFGGDYSTSEVNTGFKWIDGKDIYKKTINFGSLPNNTAKRVAHNISGATFFIDMAAPARHDDGKVHMFGNRTASNFTVWNVDDTEISCTTNSNMGSYTTCYVTLWYIKS